jgi:hypothetical protein
VKKYFNGENMLYLSLFAVILGALFSGLFLFILKRHKKKNEDVKKRSFIINAPVIFGTINIIIILVIGIWYILNPGIFSKNVQIKNQFLLILSHIFYTYFYILAMPLSIGSVVLSLFLKENIAKKRYFYGIIANSVSIIAFFTLSLIILKR